VARGGPLDPRRVSDIGSQVLSALSTAHAAGIVHRDIKPSNLMLLPGDRVKLTDFGIAQGRDDPSLTATGGVMGSPGYMAPELFQGRPPSPATDLWSLGATLFHLAEGRAPFDRGNTAATLHAILYEQPHLSLVRGPLADAITGMLVQRSEHRLTGDRARELLAAGRSTRAVPAPLPSEASTEVMPRVDDRTALVDARGSSTRQHDWEPRPRRDRRRALWLGTAAVVGVLALTGGAIAWAGSHGTTTDASPQRDHAPNVVATTSATATTTTVAPTTTTTTSRPSTTTTTQSSRTNADGAPGVPATTTAAPGYVTLYRYYDSATGAHLTAVKGTPVPKGFAKENYDIGKLLASAQPGTVRVYSCKETGNDYFTSIDQSGTCEGHGNTLMGLLGYLYKTPQGGDALTMYRCVYGGKSMHYDSIFANCDGNGTKEFVEGYQPA
jgi:serine/threonine protein kinase